MSDSNELNHAVKSWVAKADNDLEAAEIILKAKRKCPFDTVCFHAQQSAEKYLKAMLIYHSISFPKTHNLLHIYALRPKNIEFLIDTRELATLNRYAIESRYPDDLPDLTRDDAKKALAIAKRIRDFVRAVLPKKAIEE